jgi:hypothetical protein
MRARCFFPFPGSGATPLRLRRGCGVGSVKVPPGTRVKPAAAILVKFQQPAAAAHARGH